MKPGSFDWTEILSGADWFHFTGMTPALSESLAAVCYVALEAAKARQIMVSCDLNYRKNFWSKAEAGEVMSRLMPLVDVCIANEEDAADVFGISAVETDIIQGALNKTSYAQVAQELTRRFDFKSVAITLRESVSASVNHWSAMLCHQRKSWFALKYTMSIVDRVGGWDSFGAGLIYAMLQEMTPQEVIQFATAAFCLKYSIEGDFNQFSVAEVQALMGGDGSGRVQR